MALATAASVAVSGKYQAQLSCFRPQVVHSSVYRIARASAVNSAGGSSSQTTSDVLTTAFPPPLPKLDGSYEATCTFTPYANWLVPGHVMLGRYPYVEPSRCFTRDQGDEQIRDIVGALRDVITFVSLQAEVPAQESMRLAGVDGFLPYRTAAQLAAAGFSEPPSLEELSGLRTPDLDRYLPPRRTPAPYSHRRRIELDFLHAPIGDLGLPQEQQLVNLVSDLTSRLQQGNKLYIHCWGGRGRAGTVGAALLAALYNLDADEALGRVQRAFDTRQDGQRRSPETPEQHAFVRQFVAGMSKY